MEDAVQQDYATVIALTVAFIFLGLIVVCIPKPRRRLDQNKDEEK